MPALPSNIEKSGFVHGAYVGYHNGAWRIVKHQGEWRANHCSGAYHEVRGRTLADISARIKAPKPARAFHLQHKPFIHEQWHAWFDASTNLPVKLSNEETKGLRYFRTVDDCVNWLYLNDHEDAARALNIHTAGR